MAKAKRGPTKPKRRLVYYHVTHPRNVVSIQRRGIKPTDGQIFVLTNRKMADRIAADQLLIERYALFSIDRTSVTGEVVADRVVEFSAGYHRVIRTRTPIPAAAVRLLGVFDADRSKPDPVDYHVGAVLGLSRQNVKNQRAAWHFYFTEMAKLRAGKSKLTEAEIRAEMLRIDREGVSGTSAK